MRFSLLKSKLLHPLLFLLIISPAFILGTLIVKNAVNIPYWDQWEFVTVLESFHNGQLSFQNLIYQQNESRLFFPRLIFIGLAQLTRWDVRYEMLVIFLLACLTSFNIYRLNRWTVRGSEIKGLLIFFLSNLLIFAPIQHENWLWGIQLIVFVPIACVTTCIVVSYSKLSSIAKFIICAFLCTISTFSYANGIVAWVIVFPVLAISKSWKWKDLFNQKLLLGGWIACFIGNFVLYFHNYQKPTHHPSFIYGVEYPLKALNFFAAFIGSPFRFGIQKGDLLLATTVGLILIVLFIGSNIYILFLTKTNLAYETIGWQVIGSYTGISALITTLGRVGFGVEQSLASRYTTFSLYMTISVAHLIAIILNDLNNRDALKEQRLWIDRALSALLGIFLLMHLVTSVLSAQHMNAIKQERLRAKACLLLMNIAPAECLTTKLYPSLEELKRRATFLDSIGFLNPSLVKGNRIDDIGVVQANSKYGWFDTLSQANRNVYSAAGWAILPDRGESADAVILTYENKEGESLSFTLGDLEKPRHDVAKAFRKDAYVNSGWQKDFSREGLVGQSIKINAWAFDSRKGKAFKLNGTHSIQE